MQLVQSKKNYVIISNPFRLMINFAFSLNYSCSIFHFDTSQDINLCGTELKIR